MSKITIKITIEASQAKNWAHYHEGGWVLVCSELKTDIKGMLSDNYIPFEDVDVETPEETDA